jgi:creatinine amidohydrolase/Fe(II)-dependent formamide hydrolase-like protein
MYALAILSLVNLILQLVPVPKKAAAATTAAGAGAATKTADAKAGKMMADSVADYVVGAIANLSEKYD